MQHLSTWTERAATTVFRGFVTARDFLRCALELTADPRFESMAFFVADFLDISGQAIDSASVRDDLAAQALGARTTNTRYRIVVVTNDPAIDAFTEKMRALYASGGPEIFSFRTREEAASWMSMQKPTPTTRAALF